jgi:hypothetical protein
MPPTRRPLDLLHPLLDSQDQVLHRQQAYAAGLSRHAVAHRVKYDGWQEILRNVFLTHRGEPSRRQLLIAGLQYAGDGAAVDADDACAFHGLRSVRPDDLAVHLVVPQDSSARSHGFVVVRRTSAPIQAVRSTRLRVVDPATAAVAAARRRGDSRRVLAILSEAVQRRLATYEELVRAHVQGSPRNARLTDEAMVHLRAGVHSVAEGDFRVLAEASLVLPPLLYNCTLRLPDGRLVSPDALAVDAGLVHETNGLAAHQRADLFDDMQARHDWLTAAGLTVLHNSPARLHRRGREALAEVERCYLRLRGRGLPEGVCIVRS